MKDSENQTMSELTIYDFGIENFDWLLIADVDTAPEHRRKGLASSLVNQAYLDVDKNKGLYLFVKKDNSNAINLYEKMDFDHVKTYKLKGEDYYIMAKGNADKDQLKKMNFG